jgi:hypothetical protein
MGNRLGNVHLIAALFDDAPEVRDAATEALAQLGDPAAAKAGMTSLPASAGPTVPLGNDAVDEASRGEALQPESAATLAAASPAQVTGETVPAEEAKLLNEEEAARKALGELRQRLGVTASSRTRLEKEARLRLEREAEFSAAAAARRREEEELRQRLEAETLRRRAEEEGNLEAARLARVEADEKARRLAQEDLKLRLEVNRLRLAAEELARTRMELQSQREAAAHEALLAESTRARAEAEATHKVEVERLQREEEALRNTLAESTLRRAEVETAHQDANREAQRLAEEREQLAVAAAARQEEADRVRREAEETTRVEQEQLLVQVDGMRRVAEEVAVRRAEVETAREKAVEEAQRLVEAQARMKAADEARQQAEAERQRIEAELLQKVDEEQRLLEEVRRRAQEEQRRIEEDERYRAAEEEQRLARLAALRQQMEAEAQQRVEKERQLNGQIESFRLADMQARKQIEDAEARRRTAEDSYRLVAEKAQRVEAEARKGELEQERILAKLEEVRRNVAVGAQSAADQERRIKEETEQLRRLEEAQRQRIEAAARSRAEAEQRLQREKDRLQLEEDERLRASEEFNRLLELQRPPTEDPGEWRDDPAENLRPSRRANGDEPRPTVAAPAMAEALAEATVASLPAPESSVSHGGDSNVGMAAVAAVYEQTESAPLQYDVNSERSLAAPAVDFAPAPVVSEPDEFSRISARFDDPSPAIRNDAARELRELDPARVVELFNRALEEATPERRGNIGGAIATSGVAAEVIDMLGGESREDTYSALCLLLTMAKSGEVAPLVRAIEQHENVYVRIAAVRLLTLNGQEETANAAARRRLEGPI